MSLDNKYAAAKIKEHDEAIEELLRLANSLTGILKDIADKIKEHDENFKLISENIELISENIELISENIEELSQRVDSLEERTPQVEGKCTIGWVREMLMGMVKEHECPLCGDYIYDGDEDRFVNKHLPFIEDAGDSITAGIICGNRDAQRITLLRCVKEGGEVGDRTREY